MTQNVIEKGHDKVYKRILVVLPHPDDEVFPMSGSLRKHIEEGAHITYLCLTLGEMGRNLGNPAFANRVTLPAYRKNELMTSAKIIGIQDLRLLGYHDKTVEFEPFEAIDAHIGSIMAEVKPDLIYSYHPLYGVHPDHNACGAVVVRIVSAMKPEERPPVRCCAFPDMGLGEPDVVTDVSPYLSYKTEALKAHKSQFQAYSDIDITLPENQDFLKRISTERFWLYKF